MRLRKHQEKKRKNKLFLIAICFTLMISILFTLKIVSATEEIPCQLQVSLLNQDPYPATPGDYVDVVFQVSGVDNIECNGATFELFPSYPFSLDSNDGAKTINGTTWIAEHKTDWFIPYKLRVDKDALDGNNEITFHYASGAAQSQSNSYITGKINISIKDSRTAFDAVIQEVSGSDISIAIANTGKYTANSVVVRIPEQEEFTTSVTNGQMVGNLDSGDYTIVGFTISAKSTLSTPPQVFKNQDEFEKFAKNQTQQTPQQIQNKTLKFDVYYTDNIGERRIVNMQLPLNLESNSTQTTNGFNGSARKQTTQWYSSWITWVVALVVLILAYIVYKKKLFKKIFGKKDSQKSTHSGDKTPDWVKNAKEKK